MKAAIAILCALCLALCLQAQRYTALSDEVRYRFCELGGSSKSIGAGCHVQLRLVATAEGGGKIFGETCWLYIGERPKSSSVEAILQKFSQGDSVELLMPAAALLPSLISYPKVKEAAAKKSPLRVNLRVVRSVEPDIVLDDGYENFCAELSAYEKRLTERYLRQRKGFAQVGEIWKKQEAQGNGKKPEKYGDVMQVVYEGRFLNGHKFDSSGKGAEAFRYVRGQQWQVVSGLEKALASMSEGEKATYVLPSKAAFGLKGLGSIVPPCTPVVYKVEVVKVEKR
ncbi:MAG: FKBP-type peptidyl-prolyl cis-trans isomerase [Prevotellaceae bacterium]|jgi:hypothetical protein|nr:FKBP-type peptidyl-prolyl cis-trans isomerase [Prevotellaceae bacterium]